MDLIHKCEECQQNEEHLKRVNEVITKLPPNRVIENLTEFYKVMGDQTRLKILISLESRELCVSDLSCSLNMTISAVSHQLKILRTAKLVKSRKVGKTVYYSLDDNHISSILEMGVEHVLENK